MKKIQFKHKLFLSAFLLVFLTMSVSAVIVSVTVNWQNRQASYDALNKTFSIVQHELDTLGDKLGRVDIDTLMAEGRISGDCFTNINYPGDISRLG